MSSFARYGRLIYVVGPAGAGKDTLINYARHRSSLSHVVFAHRYITRPAQSSGENHIALSDEEFELRRSEGCFALSWSAHTCLYALGEEIDLWMARGLDVVANGSRANLDQVGKRYPRFLQVWVTATEETLRQRLSLRRRESAEEIDRRMQRAARFDLPGSGAIVVRNNGPLAEAGEAFCGALLALR